MESYGLNNSDFIAGGFIDPSICDKVVEYFDKSPRQVPGRLGGKKGKIIVNKEWKDSTDISFSANENLPSPIASYVSELAKVLDLYMKEYKYSTELQSPWALREGFNVQKYEPEGGYYIYHYENPGRPISVDRHLAFITYLNDVDEGGETEFYYQGVKVKPKKGLTIFFPCVWTHTHRGISAPKETKYIATGWYSFDTYMKS